MQIAAQALQLDLRNCPSASATQGADERIQVLDESSRPVGAAPRSLAIPLGLRMAGVHLAALLSTRLLAGGPPVQLILARRGARQASHAGHLDTLAGGVRRAGESAPACLRREAWEEAALPAAIVNAGRIFGTVDFDLPVSGGYARGRAVLADLPVPAGTWPYPLDGTTAGFDHFTVTRTSAGRQAELRIKPTAALALVASLHRSRARAAFASGDLARLLAAANFRQCTPRAIGGSGRAAGAASQAKTPPRGWTPHA